MELSGLDVIASGIGTGCRNPAALDGAMDRALAQPSSAGGHANGICHGGFSLDAARVANYFRKCLTKIYRRILQAAAAQ
jgi:hypothetical protein